MNWKAFLQAIGAAGALLLVLVACLFVMGLVPFVIK